MARIAVGGFQHETNTFAPQQATWEEFVRADAWPPLLRGAGDDRRRRGLQHPDRGRGEAAGRARPRDRAAGLGGGAAGLLRHRGRLREDVGAVRRGPAQARAVRRDLSRPARRHGGGEHRGRRRRAAAPHPRHRRQRPADRGEPRLSRQPDARDGEAGHGAGRLPHLSAHRHGGDRQARGRAARPAAQGEAAGLSRLPPARFPDPAGLAVHLHRAGQGASSISWASSRPARRATTRASSASPTRRASRRPTSPSAARRWWSTATTRKRSKRRPTSSPRR